MDIIKNHKEVVMYIVNDKKQVLLQRRSATKKYYPNMWALCTGHVEAIDKTYKDAAIREIKEEVGIKVDKKDLYKISQRKWISDKNHSHITYYYYIIINKSEKEFVIQEEELSEVKWFDIEDIITMVKNKDNIIFTDKMLECLMEVKKNIKCH